MGGKGSAQGPDPGNVSGDWVSRGKGWRAPLGSEIEKWLAAASKTPAALGTSVAERTRLGAGLGRKPGCTATRSQAFGCGLPLL